MDQIEFKYKAYHEFSIIINLTSHVYAELFPSARLRFTDRDGDGLLLW